MYKKQMKLQKIICLLVLLSCALVFVYSLGFMTDIYDSLYYAYTPGYLEEGMNIDEIPDEELSWYGIEVRGATIYYDMQDFNSKFTIVSIVMLVVSLVLFVTNTHSRRRYYVGNYIATLLVSACNIASVVWLMPQIMAYKKMYLETVDFDMLKTYTESAIGKASRYTDSTFWFDVSYFVFGFAILMVVLLIANLVLKVILMNAEKRTVGTRKGVGA